MLPENFPCSRKITANQFNALPREVSFTFIRPDSSAGFWADSHKSYALLNITDTEKYKDIMSSTEFSKERYSFTENGTCWVYPFDGNFAFLNSGRKWHERGTYTIDNLRPYTADDVAAHIELDDLAHMISKLSGEEIIIYTGAGISKAGNVPVWTYNELKNELGIGESNEAFISSFFKNPDEIIAKIRIFWTQLFTESTTIAHEAIAELVSLKPGTIILTENYDYKHESAGSRVSAYHMHSDENVFDVVKARTPSAKLLLTVGLSYDDVAAITYIKGHSPDVKLVSLVLSDKLIPIYTGKTDYVISGDCQELLPQLVSLVKSILSK